jgi:predicted nucleic acid-binding protein
MSAADQATFVDTNILVYAFERADSERNHAARRLLRALMETGSLRLSTQVLQEFYVTMSRKARGPAAVEEALAVMDDLSQWPLFTTDYPAVRDACLLSRDASISYWDALIVVAAARSGATRLYKEDLNHGQTILGVQITNPF